MRESQESQKTRESQESQNPQGTQPKIGRIPALIAAVRLWVWPLVRPLAC